MYYVDQRNILTDGRIEPNVTITVTKKNGDIATIFSDDSGTTLENPFVTGEDGLSKFYVNKTGQYNITATKGRATQTFNDVYIGDIKYMPNLLSNHGFEIAAPGVVLDATPRDFAAGVPIRDGWVTAEACTGVTYIDGEISLATGSYYQDVPRAGTDLQYITDFTASVKSANETPTTTGVSWSIVGDYFRITVSASNVFSVCFNEGDFAASHSISVMGQELPIQYGGTGANNATQARTNLGIDLDNYVTTGNNQVQPITTENGRFRLGMVGYAGNKNYAANETIALGFKAGGAGASNTVLTDNNGINHVSGSIYTECELGAGSRITNASQLVLYVVDNNNVEHWLRNGESGVTITVSNGVARFEWDSTLYAAISAISVRQVFGQKEIGHVVNRNEDQVLQSLQNELLLDRSVVNVTSERVKGQEYVNDTYTDIVLTLEWNVESASDSLFVDDVPVSQTTSGDSCFVTVTIPYKSKYRSTVSSTYRWVELRR